MDLTIPAATIDPASSEPVCGTYVSVPIASRFPHTPHRRLK
ncbi:hypothetical protein [Chamaesiphon sp. VAR_69_metabat_338]|nr:hypothetical protein [Chamaesiphon sp. VAR_69_metabat_338]